MKQYRVVGFDAKDERLYEVVIEAPNQAIARMMVLAQMCRNFATAPLADRTDKLVGEHRSPGRRGVPPCLSADCSGRYCAGNVEAKADQFRPRRIN